MSTSSDTTPEAFKYPGVHIDRSLTKLDLDTLMMRSTTPREEPAGSLEESNYDIVNLSDSFVELPSDDEAKTESIASTDGPTPDDASEFSDDDSNYDAVNEKLENSISAAWNTSRMQPHDALQSYTTEDSTLTEKPTSSEGNDRKAIRLREEPGPDDNIIQGSQLLRSFQKQSDGTWFNVFDQYDCSEVRLVARAGLARDSIPPPDTYKIWYLGEPDRMLEKSFSKRIGAALIACPNTSRSVMVQGQLEPYGPVITTEWCTKVQASTTNDHSTGLTLTFENGQKIMLDPRSTLARPDCPDLVVVIHPTSPSNDKQDYKSACKFFQREAVPYLELAAVRDYGHGSPQYNSKSLSVCVEGRTDPGTEFELKEVLLLDHYTFLELDPAQLNRHLALISPHLSASNVSVGKTSHASTGNTWKSGVKRLLSQQSAVRTLIVMLLSLIALLVYNPTFISSLSSMPSNATGLRPAEAPLNELTKSQTSSFLAVTSQTIVSVASVPTTKSGPNELTLVPSQPKEPKRKRDKSKGGKMGVFKIQITGDHQFILSPPEEFLNNRKKPHLQIHVSRGGSDNIPIRFNRTVSGAYVVDLEHQYPFGTFNGTIATFSKPLLSQSFDIMLGHNRSAAAELLDAVRTRLANTQNSLRGTAEQLMARLHEVEATAGEWASRVQQPDRKINIRVRKAKDLLESRLVIGTDLVKNFPGTAWLGVREVTAPIRTSEPMLKARHNALRIRCRLETATGFSNDDKKSWACLKVQS